ncbi:MAG: DNA recombination protein RmuC [Roseovarius sp.]|nr:DNA recombination protein RmuC [Roseovarius sp.]
MESIAIVALTMTAAGLAGGFFAARILVNGYALKGKNGEFAKSPELELRAKEGELREAQSSSDRFEAVSEERKAEIESLKADLSRLRQKIEEKGGESRKLSNDVARLETQLKNERDSADEKIRLLSELRDQMELKFRDMARDALKTQGEEFSKANLEKLDKSLAPLKEHVGHLGEDLKNVYKAAIEDRAALKTEIEQLGKRSEAISREAVALTLALKSDSQRQGAWGEMILENILRNSGLEEGRDYETQAHRVSDEGRSLRPDVIVNLPGGKTLVIDSKVSMVAYTDAVNAEAENDLNHARKRHVGSLKSHIDGLSQKNYHAAENSSVDYVIMFVPIEGALSEALHADGRITEYALERQITIATPTTLMMALKTVAHVWAVERRNRNAEDIAKRAGRLYDKVAGFVDSMEKVGRSLDQAKESHDKAFNQLSRGRGNVIFQVEKLKTLGANASKSINAEHDGDSEDNDMISDGRGKSDG